MQKILIVFFIVSLLFLILIFPFKARFMGHFNLIEKKGFYSFKIWRIKILCGRIFVNNENKIQIENMNNKLKGGYENNFMKEWGKKLLKVVAVKKVELFFNGGIKQNSFSSAILCGSANLLISLLYSFLSQTYENVKLYEDVTPTFDNNSLELTFDFVVEVSILQIITSLIKTKIKNRKEQSV